MLVNRGGAQLLGPNEIENLQRALINLSVATQRPAINAKITGVVDDQTMTAVSASLGLLTEELPSWLYLGLQAAMVAGTMSTTVKNYVGQYATQLTLAANTAAVKYKANPPAPVPTAPVAVGFFAPGWYKTPKGIFLIIGVLVGGWWIVNKITQPRAKAA
jgi:hypothetical protein